MTAMPRPTMGPLSPERSASRLQHMCTLSFRRGGGLVDAPGRRGECEVKKPSLSPLSSIVPHGQDGRGMEMSQSRP